VAFLRAFVGQSSWLSDIVYQHELVLVESRLVYPLLATLYNTSVLLDVILSFYFVKKASTCRRAVMDDSDRASSHERSLVHYDQKH
jgi:hypothetical protein